MVTREQAFGGKRHAQAESKSLGPASDSLDAERLSAEVGAAQEGRFLSSAHVLQRTIGNRATGEWVSGPRRAQRFPEAQSQTKVQRTGKPALQFKSGAFVGQPLARGMQVVQREWLDKGDHYEWDKTEPDGLLWRANRKGELYYELDGISSAARAGDLTYDRYAGADKARSREEWLQLEDIPWRREEVPDAGMQDAAGGVADEKDAVTSDALEDKQMDGDEYVPGQAQQKSKPRSWRALAAKEKKLKNRKSVKKANAAKERAAARDVKDAAPAASDDHAEMSDEERRRRITALAALVDFLDVDALARAFDIYAGNLEHYLENYKAYVSVESDDAKGKESVEQMKQDMKAEFETYRWKADNEPDPGTGKRSKNDWAASAVRSDAKSIAEHKDYKEIFEGGQYTLHHKVSQSRLEALYKMMNADPESKQLQAFLENDMKTALGTEGVMKNLKSMPGNLEVGPLGSRRLGDPGSHFDGNYRDGKATPRTEQLAVVDNMIASGKIDWEEVTARLALVQKLQNQQLKKEKKKGVLTKPYAEQWTKGKDNKFTRG